MRVGVVVDATCDLPQEFYEKHRIGILPVTIRLGDELLVDRREPEPTLKFYREQLATKGLDAQTVPYSMEQIRDEFLGRLVLEYDFVFVITVTSTRSPIHEHATKASFAVVNGYKAVRAGKGQVSPFAMRVLDSKQMFAGTGVLAAEACKLIEQKVPPNEIRKRLDELTGSIIGYMVPGDLYHIRTRGSRKGEKSVGLMSYALGTALDIKPVIQCRLGETTPVAKVRRYENAVDAMLQHAKLQVVAGLKAGHVCVSYGGDLAKVPQMPGYDALARACADRGIDLMVSVMSATAAVNAGGGCLAIAYAAEPVPFGA